MGGGRRRSSKARKGEKLKKNEKLRFEIGLVEIEFGISTFACMSHVQFFISIYESLVY